jgi:purine-binding chemotaxis protein CheW
MNLGPARLASSPPALSKQEILRERARGLARETFDADESTRAAGEQWEIIEFVLGGERYGIETSWVREVYPLRDLTPLPGTPAFLPGIVNVRGQILPVVDLKAFFDLPDKGLTDLNKIIIVHTGGPHFSDAMQLGILADAVVGVRALQAAALQRELPHLDGVRAAYLRGIAHETDSEKAGAGPLIVLDVAAILSSDAIVIQ